MGKFNTKNTTTAEPIGGFQSQFISYGIHLLKINGFELKVAKTNKVQVKFLVEGPEIPNFDGAELPDGNKAKGLVGRVNLGIYFDTEDETKINSLLANLKAIAEKADVVSALDAIEADNLEDFLTKFMKVIRGKYMWFIIKGDEYEKDGKKGYALSFKEGKVGEQDGKKLFQIYVKEKDFKENVIENNGRIIKITGTNTLGSSIGKKDSLEFNPNYDLKLLDKSDVESGGDELSDAKNDTSEGREGDLPF